MSVKPLDIGSVQSAIIKAIRVAIGTDLAPVASSKIMWVTEGTSVVTDPDLVFSASDYTSARTLRDAYFLTNPAKLVADQKITLLITGECPVSQVYTKDRAAVVKPRIYSSASKSRPTKPDLPYASVDFSRIFNDGSELTTEYFNDDGDYVYQTHKIVTYSVRIHGTAKDNVLVICNKLHMMLEVAGIRSIIETLSSSEVALRNKTNPVFVNTPMTDKYEEIASFDIHMAVLDEVAVLAGTAGSEYIENIELNSVTPQAGITGGIYTSDTDKLDISVLTDVTYP